MPVFLDLDNTLVDRDGAFSRWANQTVPAWGGGEADVDWLVRADAGGYTPRSDLARMISARLSHAPNELEQLVSIMRAGLVEHLECYPGVLPGLGELKAAGQCLVVVTNGDSRQQRAKIEHTGLDTIIDGAVVSGDVGFTKPDPRIFEAARSIASDGGIAWMVGDNVLADIDGARALGWSTAWVSHGRDWPEPWAPTVAAEGTADALDLIRHGIADAR